MERKAGCCLVPRYGAAAAALQEQGGAAWPMGRIMLKFRPIAPKPAAMAPAPAPTPTTPVAGLAVGSAAGRGKRKAMCGRRGRKPKKAATAAVVPAAPASAPAAAAAARDVGDCRKACDKEKSSSPRSRSSSSSGMTSVDSSPPPGPQLQQHQLATLPLMPVTPTTVEEKAAVIAATEEPAAASQLAAPDAAWARTLVPPAVPRPAASLVTVEEVTATWRDGGEAPSSEACVGPGGADDDAPAFVSDQWGRVAWRNAAFVRAVAVSAADAGGGDEEMPVVLVGALPAWGTCEGFTCRVRVRHSSSARRRVGSRSSSVVAPCDVWRLDAAGSYLWRLDLQAALTLGGCFL